MKTVPRTTFPALRIAQSLCLAVGVLITERSALAQSDTPPRFTDVSVHDPDIIKVGETFYIFGSHLAVAKSEDLVHWTKITDGVRDENPVIPNVTDEMREALTWGESRTFWAGCVTQLPNGKFAFYYCVCRGDAPRSALGIALADNVEGPYRDAGILLRSGMWGEPSEDGEIYDATVHPNAIDPHVLRDTDGDLWMVYGSYSGGIFVLRLDNETGRPLPDQGYGRKLIGGNHSRIEAPYMLHHPDTGYYYLFLSFGGLSADGGYEIRVARSENIDGPYLDPAGNPMIDVRGEEGTIFDDETIAPFGGKILGNFEFADVEGVRERWGYVSPGHNSAYRDGDTNRSYLIFHTRFPDTGNRHEVRVHPMVLNDQGWPVVAPLRYDGQWSERETFEADDVAGAYQLVRQEMTISEKVPSSNRIHLRADGSIEGDAEGRWVLSGPKTLDVTLDDVTYHAIVLEQRDAGGRTTLTIAGLADDNTSIAALQIP